MHALSVCDSWIVATAVALEAALVHKNPEFEHVGSIARLLALPYKVRRTAGAGPVRKHARRLR
jgi:predicted nucleic acid-binding protein